MKVKISFDYSGYGSLEHFEFWPNEHCDVIFLGTTNILVYFNCRIAHTFYNNYISNLNVILEEKS